MRSLASCVDMKSLARCVDLPFLALAIIVLLTPLIVQSAQIATLVLIWALFAVAFNLLLGHAGLLSFGHAALFGMGAYVSALTMIHVWPNMLAGLIAGAIAGALLAAAMGALAIQRVGVYFIMLTLAFNEVFYFTAYEWKSITGGDDGLIGVPRPDLTIGPWLISLKATASYYYFVAVLFLFSFLAIRRISRSPFGDVLRAIRENESRARAVGFSTKPYKILAFAISGFFSGLAGGLFASFIGVVPLDAADWTASGKVIIMTILGGISSAFGPVIGAAIVTLLAEKLSTLWPHWPLILGAIFIVTVLFFPGGIWHMLESARDRMITIWTRKSSDGDPRAGNQHAR